MSSSRQALSLILSLTIVMFAVACGSDVDSDTRGFGIALEEQGADAVDSDGYCERADKAMKAKQNKNKIMICHIPPGNPANAHTIVVSKNAKRAHLAHGDVLGACGCDGDDGNNGHGNPHDGHPHDGDHGDTPDGSDDPHHGDDGTDDPSDPTDTPDGDDGHGDNGYGDPSDDPTPPTDGDNGYGDPTGDNGYGGDPAGDNGYGDDGTTLYPDGGTPTGANGGTSGTSTNDPTPTGATGQYCDADQSTCSSGFDCPTNNVCDMNCCVFVIL